MLGTGVLIPLSDYGRDGAPRSPTRPGFAPTPTCGFNVRIDNGEISLGRASVRRASSRAPIPDATWPAAPLPRRGADPGPNETTVIRAIVFDLDNTLTDFMKMKARRDRRRHRRHDRRGPRPAARRGARARIDAIYDERGASSTSRSSTSCSNEPSARSTQDPGLRHRRLPAGPRLLPRALSTRAAHAARAPQARHQAGRGLRRAAAQAWMRLALSAPAPLRRRGHLRRHRRAEAEPQAVPRGRSRRSASPAQEAIMVGDWPERDVVGAAQVGHEHRVRALRRHVRHRALGRRLRAQRRLELLESSTS